MNADPVSEFTTLLREASEIVKKGFCQHALARNREGRKVHPSSDLAVSWCATGALRLASDRLRDRQGGSREIWSMRRLLAEIAVEAHLVAQGAEEQRLVRWNDRPGRTQLQVVENLRIVAEQLSG